MSLADDLSPLLAPTTRDVPARLLLLLLPHGNTKAEMPVVVANATRAARSREGRSW